MSMQALVRSRHDVVAGGPAGAGARSSRARATVADVTSSGAGASAAVGMAAHGAGRLGHCAGAGERRGRASVHTPDR